MTEASQPVFPPRGQGRNTHLMPISASVALAREREESVLLARAGRSAAHGAGRPLGSWQGGRRLLGWRGDGGDPRRPSQRRRHVLPAGREIAAEFGVSLATAAKVAGGLQALGLVQPRPGAGTVVTAGRPPADRAKGGPILITLATRSPMRPGDKARVTDAVVVQAPQAVAAQLGLGPLAQVVRHRQVVARDGVTTSVLTSWFPAALAETVPALLDKTRIDEAIEGYEPAWGEDWVSARPPTSAEARAFGIKRGSPVTVVHSRRFTADGTVLEYAELISRADTRLTYRYQYVAAETA